MESINIINIGRPNLNGLLFNRFNIPPPLFKSELGNNWLSANYHHIATNCYHNNNKMTVKNLEVTNRIWKS